MVFRSTGLKRPMIPPELADRVPPGQHVTERWPVLHHGSIPPFDPATWDFRVFGLVDEPLRFTWDDFRALPRTTVTADLHCVTRWSKLDNTWEGVSARVLSLRARVKPESKFVLLHADGGYTANVPIEAFGDAILALKHNGQDLSPEHGYPLRAVVPERYAWKSAKWLRGVEFMASDRPGFWERYGYSSDADPWSERRFAE